MASSLLEINRQKHRARHHELLTELREIVDYMDTKVNLQVSESLHRGKNQVKLEAEAEDEVPI